MVVAIIIYFKKYYKIKKYSTLLTNNIYEKL
jgi:hypothetical protein